MFWFKGFDNKFLVSFSFFIKDKIIWIFGLLSLALNLFLWLLFYIKIPRAEEIIPLHYNIYFGIDRVGEWFEIFIYPFTAFVIFLINFFLSYLIYKKEKFLSHLLSIASTVVGLVILGAGILVLMINI